MGKALIAVGALLFLFVGYQLWGTSLHHDRSQGRLKAQFQDLLTGPPSLPVPSGSPAAQAPPPPELGDAVALIEIPRIGVEEYVVEGVGVEDLKDGPGHYPGTPLPGEKGNAAIAGHRTTYGAPFYDLNELEKGDQILVTTSQGRFRYEVNEWTIVGPDDSWVLDGTPDDRLTLTTCHPRYSAAERLILVASLVTPSAPTSAVQPTAPGTPRPVARSLDAPGLSGESADRTPTVLWGAAAAAAWLVTWLAARRSPSRRRRALVYLAASPAFLVALFYFYENVARLLPANA